MTKRKKRHLRLIRFAVALSFVLTGILAFAIWHYVTLPSPEPEIEEDDAMFFIQSIEYPDWFADSTLNLPQDLKKALNEGKRGLLLYFARENCACCELMMEINFQNPDTIAYISRYFNVVAVDVWGHMKVTDFDGQDYYEARFAKLKNADATPSLIFFDRDGGEILRLRGYYSPYEFNALLDYALGKWPHETPVEYISHLKRPELFSPFDLHDNDLFSLPPYFLDRKAIPGERPLAVFFERGNCPSCDYLHQHVLKRPMVIDRLNNMEIVQLDSTENTPLIAPDGRHTNSSAWAEELGLHYSPTIVFFDESGQVVGRADSVADLRDFESTLDYVLTHRQQTGSISSIHTN